MAEDFTAAAWGRLSLVSRAWRDGLEGADTFHLAKLCFLACHLRWSKQTWPCVHARKWVSAVPSAQRSHPSPLSAIKCTSTVGTEPTPNQNPYLRRLILLLPCPPCVPVKIVFKTPMSDQQVAWLLRGTTPLLSITFCPEERRSHIIMMPVRYGLCGACCKRCLKKQTYCESTCRFASNPCMLLKYVCRTISMTP